MWVWAEETQLNTNELKNKLLQAKDIDGLVACHRAAFGDILQALETLWCWAKKADLNTDELLLAKEAELNTDELLLSQTEDGYTAFLLDAENNHLETL